MLNVLIVVLNWNGIDDTEACLVSLLAQDYNNYKIAIVDNNSSDDSVERLKALEQSHGNSLVCIYNEDNRGFAGGVNTGIRYALENDFDAVALFNNDALAEQRWLSPLVAEMNDEVSVVTGLLLHADGKTIDSTGDMYSTWGMPGPRKRDAPAKEAPESSYVFSASGGASLYKTSLFREIGLFDESFFMYYEDVDLSFRAQLAGHKVYYTNKAVAYHKQGASSGKVRGLTVYHTFKNIPLVFWKDVPTKLLIPVGARFALLYALIFANALKRGNGWYALKGWLASIWLFWTSALWQRFTIQRNKKVSADYISSIMLHDIPPEQTGMRRFRKIFTGKA